MAVKFSEQTQKALLSVLKKYKTPNSIKSIVELEGMLVGTLLRPERAHMQELMHLIWGENEDDLPVWDNQDEIESFLEKLFALQNKNINGLRNQYYKPIILKEKKQRKNWCRGLIKGIGGVEELTAISAIEDNMDLLIVSITILTLSEQIPTDTTYLNGDENFQVFLETIQDCSIMTFGSLIKKLYDAVQYNSSVSESDHVHSEHCVH